MKSVELFIALGLATTVSLSSNGIADANESELNFEEANKTNLYLISHGGEGAESHDSHGGVGGEGGEGGEGAEGGEGGGEN